MVEGDAREYCTIYDKYIIHELAYLYLEMALQDVIIANSRINNVYQSSSKFVHHLIWENSATSSFSLVIFEWIFQNSSKQLGIYKITFAALVHGWKTVFLRKLVKLLSVLIFVVA